MNFEIDLQSLGIRNIHAYETIYAEVLKLCNFDPTSTIFLQYFCDIGVLPILACQHVSECYGLDPSRYSINTCLENQQLYPHTNEIKFKRCHSKEELKQNLINIEKQMTKQSKFTVVFGPSRPDVLPHNLRQLKPMASVLRECESIERLIIVHRGLQSAVLHQLYTLSGGESAAQQIFGPPFKPVLCIPFDSNPRSGILPDFIVLYERDL